VNTGNNPRILLVCSRGFTNEQAQEIQAAIPNARYVFANDNEESIHANLSGINALINCPRPNFSSELLEKVSDSLSWVHLGGAGCEHYLIPSFVESDVVFTTGKIIQAPEIADHVYGLLLGLTRNIALVLRGQTQGMPRPIELRGKTMLVVGTGGIGTLVAERASTFGMKVLGVDPNYTAMLSFYEGAYLPEQLMELLPLADVVVNATPLTAVTEEWFGKEQFAAMKPSAYFINVSRGKVVCTESLTEALEKGEIKGAGLDVTEPEPLPEDHPLRKMLNVIITPHIAGLSEHNRQRSFELIKLNTNQFVKGLPLINVVNKKLGY